MRCISLAQAFHRVGIKDTTFLVRELSSRDHYEKLLENAGLGCIFLPDDAVGLQIGFERYYRPECFNVMVFDNYDVTSAQMVEHKGKFGNLVSIDDLADREFCADIIINQNLNAERLNYKTKGTTKMLLGPSYVLLRDNILQMREIAEVERDDDETRVFMSFGGGNVLDRIRDFLTIFSALERHLESKIHIDFAVAKDVSHVAEIKRIFSGFVHIDTQLLIGYYDLASVMKRARFAVTAAGSIVFELAFLETPQIAIIIDDNQEVTGRYLDEKGFGVCIGSIDEISEGEFIDVFLKMLNDANLRGDMALKGRSFIDGRGADRVVREISDGYGLH